MTYLPGSYSFLPWLRDGLANNITATDLDATVKVRPTVDVKLNVSGMPISGGPLSQDVTKQVELFGPGDIIGIDPCAIVKTEPRDWITNFEPTYLPFIEFYDEDFPWRYTPAAADVKTGRLRPWVMLVVLQKDVEFQEQENVHSTPLPFVIIQDFAILPSSTELWAWAHVHVNRSLADSIVTNDMSVALPQLAETLQKNTDLAYSRIVCPRKLEANTAYHAFLVPVFESGRLAGLGLDPTTAPNATFSAWDDYHGRAENQGRQLPYYYRWYFRTGTVGDFEYLVRLLQPRPVDKRVGTRDMDVQSPAPNFAGITDPALGGILKLGGALRVPLQDYDETERRDVEKYDQWAQPYPHPFQRALASLINLAENYSQQTALGANNQSGLDVAIGDSDPLVTPPLYGRWHALTRRLLDEPPRGALSTLGNWVHQLNLDPRFRVAAGFGTKIVQDRQEEYMNAAWQQVGDILEANRRIRGAQVAKAVSTVWYERNLKPLAASAQDRLLWITAPLQKRIMAGGFTLYHHIQNSRLSLASMSVAFRRILRPRSPFMAAVISSRTGRPTALLTRMNAGEVSASPEGPSPALLTVHDLARVLRPRVPRADVFLDESPTPDAIAKLLKSPDFVISRPEDGITPSVGESDSPEAVRFKRALRDVETLLMTAGVGASEPPSEALPLSSLVVTILDAINPAVTIPNRTTRSIQLSPRLQKMQVVKNGPRRDRNAKSPPPLQEVMAYPEFDMPMYKPLLETSRELFLPNMNFIAHNSLTLLETNQKFIEAYMVGLNHEFARELLWREYPTDQRGSYFRQFWDPVTVLPPDTSNPDVLEQWKNDLRDIPPLDTWSPLSKLGEHDQRKALGHKSDDVILVLRGELLKKFPTAVIYAHKAEWQKTEDGQVDRTLPRKLAELSNAEEDNPPPEKVKTPVYEAKIDPDIYFFGFNLTVEEARGGIDENDAGWFFVLKERPGEPRFGLDISKQPTLTHWNDLSWTDVLSRPSPAGYITVTNNNFSLAPPNAKDDQYEEDKAVRGLDTNAAQLAYILYQPPVLVAIHASQMLSSA